MLPPILVRMLARKSRAVALTDLEISELSGLSVARVSAISWNEDWSGVDVPTARAFLIGCGVDLEDWVKMNRIYVYLNSNPAWVHLKRSPDFERIYKPMMRRFYVTRTKPR